MSYSQYTAMSVYNESRIHHHLNTVATHDHEHHMNHVHGHTVHVHTMHPHGHLEKHDGGGLSMHGHGMAEGMNEMSNMGHMHSSSTFSLKTDADFLLEGVRISSVQGIILGMTFTFVISILFDSIKYMMYVRESNRPKRPASQVPVKKQNIDQCIRTAYHMLSITLSYIMMLCVMTMNVWILISVLVGSGIGYLFIRPLLSRKLGFDAHHPMVLKPKKISDIEREPLNDRCTAAENGPAVADNIEVPAAARLLIDRESVI